MAFKVDGVQDLMSRLRITADSVGGAARKVMHRAADRIVKNAKLNCPVDDGRLEQSIHKEVKYGYRNQLTIEIVADGVIDGKDVGEYAAIIHEHYESFKPGPGTIAKRAASPGRYVGGKFLQRALEEEQDRLAAQIEKAMQKQIAEIYDK
jgi:Bacteriophage HK97-gp10, putative tail-component